jgi:parallel beta-helix repeat protein
LGANVLTIDGGAGTNRIFQTNLATVTIADVRLTGGGGTGAVNSSLGGAIFAQGGSLTLERVHIAGNSATFSGGGVYFNSGTNHRVSYSTVSNNNAISTCGGFATNNQATLTVVNSTIFGNTASVNVGGGFCVTGASNVTLRNVTVTGNTATMGGGFDSRGTLNFGNTIVAGNTATGTTPPGITEINFATGTIISAGNNLVGDSPGDASNTNSHPISYQATDILDTPPMLGALQNYGGPTPTLALLSGSPAIDAGNNAQAVDPISGAPLTTDQRGFLRIVDSPPFSVPIVDIGAFEREVLNYPPTLSNVAITSPINESSTAVLSGTITDPDTGDTFSLTVDWGDGSAPQTFNYPAGTISFTESHQYLDDNPTATTSDNYTISLTLSDTGSGGTDTDLTSVTVNNLAPTLTNVSVNPATIIAGDSTVLSGNVSDAGTQDTHTVQINWGDGSPNTTLTLAAGVSVFNANHQYLGAGNFTIAITATDDDSAAANAARNVVVNPLLPPNAPSNLTAPASSATQIDLSWSETSNNEDGFRIERCAGKNCKDFVEIAQVGANVVALSDTGVNRNTNYLYRVRAFNGSGNSAYSNTASVKTLRR